MSGEYVAVKVTDASVRECVMYVNLHFRGVDTNSIGTPLTVEISEAFDAWLQAHDARIASEAAEKALREAAEEVARKQALVIAEKDREDDSWPGAEQYWEGTQDASEGAVLELTARADRLAAEREASE